MRIIIEETTPADAEKATQKHICRSSAEHVQLPAVISYKLQNIQSSRCNNGKRVRRTHWLAHTIRIMTDKTIAGVS